MSAETLLLQYSDKINELCKGFAVANLWLFGSGLTEKWDAKTSDLDFMVEYGEGYKDLHPLESLVGLKMALEELLRSNVDVINIKTVRNPEFVSSALEHSRLIYAT